jgi:hypothetical protein
MKKSKGNWINIGYYRKSPSKETIETHKRLLLLMSNRLISKYLCKKVYVSFCSQEKDPLLGRGQGKYYNLGDGNTQRK